MVRGFFLRVNFLRPVVSGSTLFKDRAYAIRD
jgi:hypothetical protein